MKQTNISKFFAKKSAEKVVLSPKKTVNVAAGTHDKEPTKSPEVISLVDENETFEFSPNSKRQSSFISALSKLDKANESKSSLSEGSKSTTKLTPLERQVMDIKDSYKDCLLMVINNLRYYIISYS